MQTLCLMVKLPQGMKILDVADGYPIFLGRSIECDVYLPSPAVSKRHAVVLARGGEVGLKDLESTNGTFLNSKRLSRPVRLKLGDTIQIGPFAIEFTDRAGRRPADLSNLLHKKSAPLETAPDLAARASAVQETGVLENADPGSLFTNAGTLADVGAHADNRPRSGDKTAEYLAAGSVTANAPAKPAASQSGRPPTAAAGPAKELAAASDAAGPDSASPVARELGVKTPFVRHHTSIRYATDAIGPDNIHRSDELAEERAEAEEQAISEELQAEAEARKRKPTTHIYRDAAAGQRAMNGKAEPAGKPGPKTPAVTAPPTEKKAPPPPKIVLPDRLNALPERYAAAGAMVAADSVGSGANDGVFAVEAQAEEEDRELALAKAAAEAGVVGEFVPEVDTPPPGQPGQPGQPGALRSVAETPSDADLGKPFKPPPDSMPVDRDFRRAIEGRLNLYDMCAVFKEERATLLAATPDLPDAVKAEYDRQDRETDKIPDAARAEDMIAKRLNRRKDLNEKIAAARENDLPPPPLPSKEMLEAENMAINQWTLFADSQRLALPAVIEQGWRLGQREPLVEALGGAKLDTTLRLGGGIYLRALGIIAEEAAHKRAQLRVRLNEAEAAAKKSGQGRSAFGLFSKISRGSDDDDEEETLPRSMSLENLRDRDKQLAIRIAGINQETVYIESMLIKEFWDVYEKTCLAFLPKHETMELPVRAFLRYGVVGFAHWWLKPEVRKHVVDDCKNDVVKHLEVSKSITNVVYADEYLAAVMNRECTPAMDENLEINERNSPNWKADKALRKLINAKAQRTLLNELLDSLALKVDAFEKEMAAVEDKLKAINPNAKTARQDKSELSQARQTLRVEISKLTSLQNKITGQTLAILAETIQETENRFSSGELPEPTREFLISRECGAVRKIGRLLANLKEKFMPLVMRDLYQPGTDAANDRKAILAELADIERRDPGLFLEFLVASKKKSARVDLRISPVIALLPAAGQLAFAWNPRSRPEDGKLAIPTCFIRQRLRERQLT